MQPTPLAPGGSVRGSVRGFVRGSARGSGRGIWLCFTLPVGSMLAQHQHHLWVPVQDVWQILVRQQR